ncbi:MAG: DUF1194 domain-containing protein [Amaricoccus sp.]
MPSRRTFRSLVAALSLLAAVPAAAQPAPATPVDAEIVLAVDVSRSMDMAEFDIQRDGYAAALRHPDLMRAVTAGRLGKVAIAYFEWGGKAQDRALIPWRIIDSPDAAARMADEIDAMPRIQARGTSISRALGFGSALIDDGSVEGARRIIDISGDGANNVGPPVTGARDATLVRGITINGLPIIASPGTMPDLDSYYRDCVVGGDGAFVLVARNAAELGFAIRRKLVLEISGAAPPLRPIPADYAPMDCLIGEKQFRGRNLDGFR